MRCTFRDSHRPPGLGLCQRQTLVVGTEDDCRRVYEVAESDTVREHRGLHSVSLCRVQVRKDVLRVDLNHLCILAQAGP